MIATLMSAATAAAILSSGGTETVWIDLLENAGCGKPVAAGALLPSVAKRHSLSAGNAREDGIFWLVVNVSADGAVGSIALDPRSPSKTEASVAALHEGLQRWTFEPGAPGPFCILARIDAPPYGLPHGQTFPPAPKPSEASELAYPEDALKAGVRGYVELLITIDELGAIADAAVAMESPWTAGFGEAALDGVKTWKFVGAKPGVYLLKVSFKPPAAGP